MDSAMAGPTGNKRPYYPMSANHEHEHEHEHDLPPPQSQSRQSSLIHSNSDNRLSHDTSPKSPLETSAAAFSAFRNVSACNRCRLRKNRCDTRLPRCSACERAKVKCTGYDPVHKREIPRSYVYWLENRVAYFETLLVEHGVSFKPPEAFDPDLHVEHGSGHSPSSERSAALNGGGRDEKMSETQGQASHDSQVRSKKQEEKDKVNKLVSDVGMVSMEGASDPRWLGSTSGIPFARVVFAALKSSVSTNNSEKSSVRASKPASNAVAGSSMRDSAFRLHTNPTASQAAFPAKHLGEKLVDLYFEHANPQIPILHRDDFKEQVFSKAYPEEQRRHLARRELYMLNMVFAIGAGIIYGSSNQEPEPELRDDARDPSPPSSKRAKLTYRQQQPEEYHAAAMVYFDSIFGPSSVFDRSDGFGGGLEELQALLLLASFALLRPVTPGLWHIVGFAVRTALELGLHSENGTNLEGVAEDSTVSNHSNTDSAHRHHPPIYIEPRERGRRQWVRDLRRRLFWSTYSLDRLVSTCVGRPIGISDQAITTEFPSILDDQYISHTGIIQPPVPNEPSYKRISHHYFRLRTLQSEILQVLQYREARQARSARRNGPDGPPHIDLPLSFLDPFESFQDWRKDIDHRLWEWKRAAPTQEQTGVQFQPLFLELNYWQAVIMLYRQSLAVPAQLASTSDAADDLASPTISISEEKEEEDEIFLKVAEAGQQVLKLYRTLHRVRLVNYTYLATHHLFMAGISFLYALWHSPVVRSQLTADDVDFTVLAALSVLGDLTEECPPAEACRTAFDRMSKATVQMCLSTTGFGAQVPLNSRNGDRQNSAPAARPNNVDSAQLRYLPRQPTQPPKHQRPPPKFDTGFKELFTDDTSHYDLPSQSLANSMLSRQQHQRFHPQGNPKLNLSLPPENPSSGSQTFLPPHFSTVSPVDNTLQDYSTNSSTNASLPPSQPHSSSMDLSNPQQTDPFAPAQAVPPPSSNFTFGPTDFAGMPDMSFLDTVANSNESDPLGDGGYGGGGGAIDLGFGMGMDLQHDWSEGNQFELLDGLFFGGGGGGSGSGGAGGYGGGGFGTGSGPG